MKVYVGTCDECGYRRQYASEAKAQRGLRMHSCEKQLRGQAATARNVARDAAVDRTPKTCTHPQVNHRHGTYACYQLDGCRCLRCSYARSLYTEELKRQQATGTVNRVDAGPVRAHVQALQAAGLGSKTIAARADVSVSAIGKLLWGKRRPDGTRIPSERVTRSVAERIMRVPMPTVMDLAGKTVVDSTGTRRRLQALAVNGWSVPRLAVRAGVNRQALDSALRGEPILARTAQAVTAVYEQCWNVPAPQVTRTEKAAASRARRRATESGWAPAMAWDEDTIDDPTAKPAPWTEERRGGRSQKVFVDDIEFLLREHPLLTAQELADRFTVDRSAVQSALDRAGRDDLLERLARNIRLAA